MRKIFSAMLATAVTAVFSTTAFAADTGETEAAEAAAPVQRIAELIHGIEQLEEQSAVLTASVIDGDNEYSAGATIRVTGGEVFFDEVFISLPFSDGTTLDADLSDFLRITKSGVYLNSDDVIELINDAAQDDTYAELENALGLPPEGWIEIEGVENLGIDISENAIEKLLDGLMAVQEGSSYMIEFDRRDVQHMMANLETQIREYGSREKEKIAREKVLREYMDAMINGMRRLNEDAVTEEQQEDIYGYISDWASVSNIPFADIQKMITDLKSMQGTFCIGKDMTAQTYAVELSAEVTREESEDIMYISFFLSTEPLPEEPDENLPGPGDTAIEDATPLKQVLEDKAEAFYRYISDTEAESDAQSAEQTE